MKIHNIKLLVDENGRGLLANYQPAITNSNKPAAAAMVLVGNNQKLTTPLAEYTRQLKKIPASEKETIKTFKKLCLFGAMLECLEIEYGKEDKHLLTAFGGFLKEIGSDDMEIIWALAKVVIANAIIALRNNGDLDKMLKQAYGDKAKGAGKC